MTEKDTTALEAKRDELLAEVKDLKAKLKTITEERDEAVKRADGAEADIHTLRVDNPVNSTLDDIFTIRHEKARRMLGDEYQFKLTDEGIKVFKGEDEIAPLDDKKALSQHFSEAGLDDVLVGTRASGAGGSTQAGETVRPKENTEQPRQFGLR